jgi:hypothetical protein
VIYDFPVENPNLAGYPMDSADDENAPTYFLVNAVNTDLPNPRGVRNQNGTAIKKP